MYASVKTKMERLLALVTVCSLLGRGIAIPDDDSIPTTSLFNVEQYCFPKPEGPFPNGDMWSSITMTYSGVTLTATSTGVTVTATIGTGVRNPAISDAHETGVPPPSASDWASGSSGQPYISPGSIVFASNTGLGGPVLTASSELTTVKSETSARFGSSLSTMSALPGLPPNSDDAIGADRSSIVSIQSTLSGSSVSAVTTNSVTDENPTPTNSVGAILTKSDGVLPSVVSSLTTTSVGDADSTSIEGLQPSAFPVPQTPGSQLSDKNASGLNATLDLSPAAVDALHLAQFLKNLDASVFNSSNYNNMQQTEGSADAALGTNLIANISLVCLLREHKTFQLRGGILT